MLVLFIGVAVALGSARRTNAAPKPVLRRLLPPLAALVILLMAGAGMLLWQQHGQRLDEEIAADLTDASGDLQVALDQQAASLSVVVQPIDADAMVKKDLREGAADRLLARWQPMFEKLRRQKYLTQFYFYDKNRVCLVRVHMPEQRGGRIEHFTAREAERTGKTTSGLELGRQGLLTLRVVEPVFEGGRLVGYVELGMEIGEMLQTLHARSVNHVAVVIHKEHLDRQRWEEGMRWLGRKFDWEHLSRGVVIYASQGRLPNAFASWADSLMGTHAPREINREIALEGKDWRVSAMSLKDASGKEIGDLLIMRNITVDKAAFARRMILGGTISVVLLVLLLGGLFVLLRRTDAGVHAQQVALRESEANFRAFFNAVDDIILVGSLDGKILHANSAVTQTLGYTLDELKRMHLLELHPANLRREGEEIFAAMFKGERQSCPLPLARKDGVLVPSETRI